MDIHTDDSFVASYSHYSTSPSSSCSFPPSPSFDFPVAAHLARRLRLASPSPGSYYSDELAHLLVADLESDSPDSRRLAALELRMLAKDEDGTGIRLRIAAAGAVPPLLDVISHRSCARDDPELHENAVTAVLNLSLSAANAGTIVDSGAVPPLCRAVGDSAATPAARANAACALMRLARSGGVKACSAIGAAGGVELLANLLSDDGATLQERKDAAVALYALCSGDGDISGNAFRAVDAGVVETLIKMVAEEVLEEAEEAVSHVADSTPSRHSSSLSSSSASSSNRMADRALCVLSAIVTSGGFSAAEAVAEAGGVGVLVEVLEAGTRKQREAAAEILMRVCGGEGADELRKIAVQEGAVPPLIELGQTGSPRVRKTAEALTALLRLPRTGSTGRSSSSLSRASSE